MFREEAGAMAQTAKTKAELLKSRPAAYFVASMLGGAYVGIGVLLAYTVGGLLGDAPYSKIAMGLSFGIALSLIFMAGGELFTGNNLVMALGCIHKTVGVNQTAGLWLVCFVGNWVGGVLLALLYTATGCGNGAIGAFIAAAAVAKMGIAFGPLVVRGMLCNLLVCLAVWCAGRSKSEAGKLIMALWCLFAFVTVGFEHCVANMTLLTAALLSPAGQAVSLGGYFYNILAAGLGNVLGGVLLVALPYGFLSRR